MVGVIRGLEPIMAVAQRLQLFASLLYGVHKPATEWVFCCVSKTLKPLSKDLEPVGRTASRDVMLHFHGALCLEQRRFDVGRWCLQF
jgi:hypothetical protein